MILKFCKFFLIASFLLVASGYASNWNVLELMQVHFNCTTSFSSIFLRTDMPWNEMFWWISLFLLSFYVDLFFIFTIPDPFLCTPLYRTMFWIYRPIIDLGHRPQIKRWWMFFYDGCLLSYKTEFILNNLHFFFCMDKQLVQNQLILVGKNHSEYFLFWYFYVHGCIPDSGCRTSKITRFFGNSSLHIAWRHIIITHLTTSNSRK